MSPTHRVLRIARSIHLHLGVFSAPMLLFFAITGGLQTFGMHEAGRGSSYAPPAWLASMAQLHKKQTVHVPPRRQRAAVDAVGATHDAAPGAIMGAPAPMAGRSPAAAASRPVEQGASVTKASLLPMKLFFALISLSLLVSSLTGLYLAWRFSRRPGLFGMVLLAGFIVPIVLGML